ncbi:MAG: CaiB/BaiF CoA-transferase family protein [Acidobacteriota bacterium]|nr:CoA transferase [Blastocatellia bacterium]MDW8413695.1 CaiB/BaiF CoA-transferase family protein [Acidobacteriota bacterium]
MFERGPLTGIYVLDLSRILAGPFCTQILGDFGAEVIKVERPNVGDDTRYWGPPFLADGMAAYFTCANRNKRSIAVDIKTEKGREILRRLACRADVLVENYKVGQLRSLGLGYDDLAKLNPRLVYCSITGFGQTGPRASEPGYDFLMQAMGGLMSITGTADEPCKVGVAVADLFTGLWAAVAILAALRTRELTGRGQYIDLALYDCQLSMLANVAANWFVSTERPVRYGNAHPNIVPYQVFQAADGLFALAIGNDKQFKDLCIAFDSKLYLDERFATNAARVVNRNACVGELSKLFIRRNRREILKLCASVDVPAGPINSVDEAFLDQQALHRNMVVELDGVKTIANPVRFSDTAVSYRIPPPKLGADTTNILRWLGYTDSEIEAIGRQGT